MKIFYIAISLLIIILNFLSIIAQVKSNQTNKCFSIIAISVNANDSLCGAYLSFIWVADLSFGGSFNVKEDSWRSSFPCLIAFTVILCFTVPSQLVLIFMSLTRLMVTISPLSTKFKDTMFITKSLTVLVLLSLVLSLCTALIFKFTETSSMISLCLSFLDPTSSQLSVKLITRFTVLTQLVTTIVIMIMHIFLVAEIKRSQQNIQKSKTENGKIKTVIIQLFTVTLSNILCWCPAGCIFITAMFLPLYPVDLVIWTTVIGLPINSIFNPTIFIVDTIRNMIQFKPKLLPAGNTPVI